jgi:heptaprenyl diphosphate synthase
MALLFGTATSFWFSLTGGAVSFIMLVFCLFVLRSAVTPVGAAVACAAGHNAGQILAAVLMFGDTSLFYFMPWLLIISIFTGIATGVLLYILSGRLKTK